MKYYKLIDGNMLEVKESVSNTKSFENQWIRRQDHEGEVGYAFNCGRQAGAEEKHLDYITAKQKRIFDEKRVLNDAARHIKVALEKLGRL